MKTVLTPCLLSLFAAVMVAGVVSRTRSAEKAEPRLAHMVFFTLKDHSEGAREKFVASCQKYLGNHEGTISFSVGTIAEDVEEAGVSVRDFDVALHLVFENKAAKAKYLEHPNHHKFVDENKASFAKVRVFDSYLATAKH
jgi:hypothetical protein